MRWFRFVLFFTAIVFCCFASYAFLWRVALTRSAIEQSCQPCQVSLDSLEIVNTSTICLNNLSLSHQEGTLHIKQLLITPSSWLSWIFLPSSGPLSIDDAYLKITQSTPITFDNSGFPLHLAIDTTTVEYQENTPLVLRQIAGPVHEVVEKIQSVLQEQKTNET